MQLLVSSDGLALRAGGFHTHFDDSDDAGALVRDAFGLVRDLLSPAMRLREWRAGNVPYRWVLEVQVADGWRSEQTMGLLFWNYFGRRSERVYQNRQLPARER